MIHEKNGIISKWLIEGMEDLNLYKMPFEFKGRHKILNVIS